MFLLFLVFELMEKSGISKPIVCYLDHKIRSETLVETELIEMHCAKKNVKFFKLEANVPKLAQKTKMSIEETGRWVRYKKFSRVKSNPGPAIICTAHHSDDYFESLLMHFIRGGGRSALKTMPIFKIINSQTRLFRPLMFINKKTILENMEKFNIRYIEDPTNFSEKFLRNKIRSKIVPFLKEQGLNTVKIWKNFHKESNLPSIDNISINQIEYLSIDRKIFNFCVLSHTTLKNLLDVYLESMGLFPAKTSLLNELQKQSSYNNSLKNRIFTENKELVVSATPQGEVWLFNRKAGCFKGFNTFIKQKQKLGQNDELTISYNGKTRVYESLNEIEVKGFQNGMFVQMRSGGRKKIKKIFQEKKIPSVVRKYIPVLYNNKTGQVERICLSFWNNGKDLVY